MANLIITFYFFLLTAVLSSFPNLIGIMLILVIRSQCTCLHNFIDTIALRYLFYLLLSNLALLAIVCLSFDLVFFLCLANWKLKRFCSILLRYFTVHVDTSYHVSVTNITISHDA